MFIGGHDSCTYSSYYYQQWVIEDKSIQNKYQSKSKIQIYEGREGYCEPDTL